MCGNGTKPYVNVFGSWIKVLMVERGNLKELDQRKAPKYASSMDPARPCNVAGFKRV